MSSDGNLLLSKSLTLGDVLIWDSLVLFDVVDEIFGDSERLSSP